MNPKRNQFDPLTIADLLLVARARGVEVPAGATRGEVVRRSVELEGWSSAPGAAV